MPKHSIKKVAQMRAKKDIPGTSRSPSIRKHLEAIGEAALTELVLELSRKHRNIQNELRDRFSTTDERFVRLEKSIQHFKPNNSDHHYCGDGTEDRVRKIVDGIGTLDDKPEAALELLALLFEKDDYVMENAGDYDDCNGEVFTNDATDLFGELAQKITNKILVENVLFQLLPHDNYGTRTELIKNTHTYLHKSNLKNLIERFVAMRSQTKAGSFDRSSHRHMINELLSQCNDAAYYESTLLAFDKKETPELCFDIARSWFAAKDYLRAYDWLQKIPETDASRKSERLEMLMVIHSKRKDAVALADTAHEVFARRRSKENFQKLLDVIGSDKRNSVLAEAINEIEKRREVSSDDVDFLVSVGAVDEAENYLWQRISRLSKLYGETPYHLARLMASKKRPLLATVIFREMVEYILHSARSKDYPKGISYMNALQKLTKEIDDWKKIKPHDEYVAVLKEQYPRRPSFWPRINWG